jgi:GNAT superfamily N-acetyltransferase
MASASISKASGVTGEAISFRGAGEFPDPIALISRALPWIVAAGQPYFDWFCGGRDIAERTVAMWMARPDSEVSIQRMQFLQYGSEIAGGIFGLGGAQLKKARIADTGTFWATLDAAAQGALIERLSQSANVFAPVADDEYYASKMGLDHAFLGKGLGKIMLERCVAQGAELGYSKFRADVQTENEPSLRCCLALGFQIFHTGESADGALRYHALRLERKNP